MANFSRLVNNAVIAVVSVNNDVLLDENVPYNEIWVCREQNTYGITLEDREGDTPIITFNHGDMFDKKKLRGRIKINE